MSIQVLTKVLSSHSFFPHFLCLLSILSPKKNKKISSLKYHISQLVSEFSVYKPHQYFTKVRSLYKCQYCKSCLSIPSFPISYVFCLYYLHKKKNVHIIYLIDFYGKLRCVSILVIFDPSYFIMFHISFGIHFFFFFSN